MEIVIKKFSELSVEELYSILRLRAEVFVVEQDCPYQDLDNMDQDAVHAFTMDNGSVVSYLRVFLREGGTAQIGRVVTDKRFRGKGISLSLLKEAVRIAGEHFFRTKDHTTFPDLCDGLLRKGRIQSSRGRVP